MLLVVVQLVCCDIMYYSCQDGSDFECLKRECKNLAFFLYVRIMIKKRDIKVDTTCQIGRRS